MWPSTKLHAPEYNLLVGRVAMNHPLRPSGALYALYNELGLNTQFGLNTQSIRANSRPIRVYSRLCCSRRSNRPALTRFPVAVVGTRPDLTARPACRALPAACAS